MGKRKEKKSALTQNQAIWCYVKNSPWYGVVFIVTFIIFLACQTSRQISDWWLRQWTADAKQW